MVPVLLRGARRLSAGRTGVPFLRRGRVGVGHRVPARLLLKTHGPEDRSEVPIRLLPEHRSLLAQVAHTRVSSSLPGSRKLLLKSGGGSIKLPPSLQPLFNTDDGMLHRCGC